MEYKEKKLANLLLSHSLNISKEDRLLIDYQDHCNDLLLTIEEEINKIGASYFLFSRPRNISLIDLSKLEKLVDKSTSYLRLGGGEYKILSRENREINRKEGEIMLKRCNLKWVSTQYPSKEMARSLDKSLEELKKRYFRSCFVDYSLQKQKQKEIASLFDEGEIRIKSEDTDLTFKIIGKPHFCDGSVNIPDGELFYEIDPEKTKGYVSFSLPTIFGAFKFNNIQLKFLRGKISDYKTNDDFSFKSIINIDENARYLGEFGIGTNPEARIVGNSFYDEKVNGTFHLALGAMSKEKQSRLHLDLVKYFTGCKIFNNGKEIEKAI